MTNWDKVHQRLVLFSQLCWFVRLRWFAAAAVIVGSLADWLWMGWYSQHVSMLAVGTGILAYNGLLCLLTRPSARLLKHPWAMVGLAWVQILLDLGCLTLLTLWTGNLDSPLLGFFVFHMVFASLLLNTTMAYGGAVVAWACLAGGLAATGHWPDSNHLPILAGWMVMLLMTVYLTNHITRNLRRNRRRLLQQNHRIRVMSDQLRRQRQAMAQHEKMVAMGQMAAGVAHEIANPLACMDSLLQLVQRKGDRIQGDTVDKVRAQIGRINQIVQQLTRFARLPETQCESIPVADIVERALDMVRFDHRIRQVRIDRQVSPSAGTVRVQPHALEQVLVNLFLNALDAMADVPQPVLQIRAQRQDSQSVIEVVDNGHGIAAEHMSRLFEPFFTTKPVGKGTGLGLSISYSLVRNHGGQIAVSSTPGQGAKFTISLPIAAGVS